MIRNLNRSDEVDSLLDVVMSEQRQVDGRPWVMLNMISTLDGATAIDGRSSSIGGPDDSKMFKAIRAVPDVILVGAGTVTAEDYRPVVLDEERRSARSDKAMSEAPTLAIVSGRLSIDPDARVFGDPDHKTLIITSTEANPSKLALIGDAADVAILPSLDPETILNHLGAARIVLVEGGPSLNGQFVAAGLVDEVNLTIASKIGSGDSRRIIHGLAAEPPLDMTIDRVLQGEEELFLRYLRR